MNSLITTKQLADKLQIAEVTIHKWRKKGLPFVQLGRAIRFNESEVAAWIEQQNSKK